MGGGLGNNNDKQTNSKLAQLKILNPVTIFGKNNPIPYRQFIHICLDIKK